MFHFEHHVADPDLAGIPVSDVGWPGWDLGGEAEPIGRDGAGGDNATSGLATECIGDLVGIRGDHDVEPGIDSRKIVQPTGQSLKSVLTGEPRERLVNSIAASKVKEVLGRENTTMPLLAHAFEDLVLKVVHEIQRGSALRYFSDNTIYQSIGKIVVDMNILATNSSDINPIFSDHFVSESGLECVLVVG